MEQLEEINRKLNEMAVENKQLGANRSQEIDQLRRDINSGFQGIKSNVEQEQEQDPGIWLVLSDTARRGQAYFAEQAILQSLRFPSIDSRHQSISKEHSQTFLWIFDETSSTKFVDGVYWISGKPGSGKSTLLKFVAEHEKTRQHLKALESMGWRQEARYRNLLLLERLDTQFTKVSAGLATNHTLSDSTSMSRANSRSLP